MNIFFKKKLKKTGKNRAESPILTEVADVTVKFSEKSSNNFNMDAFKNAIAKITGGNKNETLSKHQLKTNSINICREIASHGQGFVAVNKIVNEAIVIDNDNVLVSASFKNLIKLNILTDEESIELKEEFQKMLIEIEFVKKSKSLFRHFYVDGRLHLYKIRDSKTNEIVAIDRIDPVYLDIIHEQKLNNYSDTSTVDINDTNKYYKYTRDQETKEIPYSEITSCYSNYISPDGQIHVSNLMPCVPYANKLKIMEQAMVINAVNKSVKRTLWQVDMDDVPMHKQSEFLNEISSGLRTESVLNTSTGLIDSNRAFPSTSEDIVLPVHGSNSIVPKEIGNDKNTTIDTKEIEHLQRQLTECLIVPSSRYDTNSKWQLGADNSITRQEIEFSKLIKENLNIFSEILQDLFIDRLTNNKTVSDDIINKVNKYKNSIGFKWNNDRFYEEIKRIEEIESRASAYSSFRELINNQVLSPQSVAEVVLGDAFDLETEQEIIRGNNDKK